MKEAFSLWSTFLTPEDRDPIANAVAEGVAFFITSDRQDRMKYKATIKKLYDKRSRISHGGCIPILQAELAMLKDIAAKFINVMIHRHTEFVDKKSILAWIEEQKFS